MHKWYIELLEFCRSVAGLPAIVTIMLELLRFKDAYVKVGTAVALLVAIILRFFAKLRVSTVLPLSLSAVLTVVLIVFVFPFRARQDSNSLASSWLDWENSLEKSVGQCRVSNTSPLPPAEAACLAKPLIQVINDRPRPQEQSVLTRQASDLLAGQAVFANYKSRALLDSRLSIGKQFVGSGYSEPVDEQDPSAARVAEYLVPNLNDHGPYVWFWKIDRTQIIGKKRVVDRKLLEVLLNTTPDNHPGFKENWGWMSQNLQLENPRPIMVRFAVMDPKKHSGCLGRPEATRVFMSNLGQIEDLTVDAAARNTGHRGPEKDDNPDFRLLVWVYAPQHEDQAVRATWGNVLENFESWINDKPCETP